MKAILLVGLLAFPLPAWATWYASPNCKETLSPEEVASTLEIAGYKVETSEFTTQDGAKLVMLTVVDQDIGSLFFSDKVWCLETSKRVHSDYELQ